MSKETNEKGTGWFKGFRQNRNNLAQETIEEQAQANELLEESEEREQQSNKHIFLKDNQDKVGMDIIVALENMLKDRKLMLYKNEGLEDQLSTANETINRLKQDQVKKERLLEQKNEEINTLEDNLTDKQMGYDQILEDYKEYQSTSTIEYEKISNQLDTEINKYNKLNEELTSVQYQSMLKINKLEDKIRNLEIENQKYAEQYQKTLNDKADLMQRINDFTEQMSFSISPKTTDSNPSVGE